MSHNKQAVLLQKQTSCHTKVPSSAGVSHKPGGTTGASWQIRAAFIHCESSCILALKNPHQSMCPSQSNQQSMCQPIDNEEAAMHCRVALLPRFYLHKHAVCSIKVLQAAMHCSKVRHMPCWQHPYDVNVPCRHCHTCFVPAAADCAAQRSGCPTPVVMPGSCARAAAHTMTHIAHQLHLARLLRAAAVCCHYDAATAAAWPWLLLRSCLRLLAAAATQHGNTRAKRCSPRAAILRRCVCLSLACH